MNSKFLLTNKSSLIAPVVLAGITCCEGVDPNILLNIHDFVNNREVVRQIPVVKFNPKTLQQTIERANGFCPDAKACYEQFYAEYKRKLVDQTINVMMKHQRLGWQVSDEGELEFRGERIISSVPKIHKSYYEGGKELLAPIGSIKSLTEMVENQIIGTEKWSPLEAVLAFGAGATVLPFANKMWGLNMNNHIIHLIGSSTTGKSTALELMVGCGSNPEPKKGFSMSYVSTDNSLMHKIGDNSGFPVGIDELTGKSTRKSTKFDTFVYTIGNGEEKDRLGAGGRELQNSAVFSTIVLSTGESSLLDKCSNYDGIYSRATEIAHEQWTISKEQSDAIKTCMQRNYGGITMLVASELLTNSSIWKHRWDYWQLRVDDRIKKEKIIFSVRDRVAQYVVLFCTAAEIVNKVLGVRLDIEEIMKFCFYHFLIAKAEDTNLAERACDHIKRFLSKNRVKILDYITWNMVGESILLDDEQIGFTYEPRFARTIGGVKCKRVFAIRREVFETVLESGQFPVKVTMRRLRDANYLMTKGTRNYDKSYTVGDIDIPFVVIFVPDRQSGGIGFGDEADSQEAA